MLLAVYAPTVQIGNKMDFEFEGGALEGCVLEPNF